MTNETLVDLAGELNAKLTAGRKVLDGYKKSLKNTDAEIIGGSKYSAKITDRVAQKFNKDRLMQKVKSIHADWLLKEVVDEELLESEIITGKLNAEDFADCIDTSTTKMIKFKKMG